MESLYRTYRPLTFDDVVGQQHVVSTLEHAVTEGRISHAYLFCGPRGTGKTTMARILAKSLLCERAATDADGAGDGEPAGCLPDGTCAECRAIAEGSHPDVYELDAASRTGVDNVREEIINSVDFAPVRGRYKIYIIDEVHMLSTAAFNALLKTLEEPPAHVVFVLCTTDPQKLPETILSRCQRFDFHRISNEDIVGRLRYVCEQEGFAYDEQALDLVARHARGGMRDALSTLEQLSVFGDGSVRMSDARALLGEASSEVLSRFSRGIARRDTVELFSLVREQVDAGNDILEFTRDLVAHMRDVYTASIAGDRPELFDIPADEVRACVEEAALFEGTDRLARTLTVLDDAALEMRTASDPRLVLEIALTRLARPESDLTLESLAERVERLEVRLADLSSEPPEARAGSAPTQGPAPSEPDRGPSGGRPQPSVEVRPASAASPRSGPASQARPSPAPSLRSESTSAPQPASTQAEEPAAVPRPEPAGQRQGVAPAPAPSDASRAGSSPGPAPATADQQRRWAEVVSRVTREMPSRGGLLQNAHLWSDDGERLVVWLPERSNFAINMLGRADTRAIVQPSVDAVFGHRSVTYVLADDPILRSGDGVAESAAPAGAAAMGGGMAPAAAAGEDAATSGPAAMEPAQHLGGSATIRSDRSAAAPAAPETQPQDSARPRAAPVRSGSSARMAPEAPGRPAPSEKVPAPVPVHEPVYDPVPYGDEDVGPSWGEEDLPEVDLPWEGGGVSVPDRPEDPSPSGEPSKVAPAAPSASPRGGGGVQVDRRCRQPAESEQSDEDMKAMLGDIFGAGTIFMDDEGTDG